MEAIPPAASTGRPARTTRPTSSTSGPPRSPDPGDRRDEQRRGAGGDRATPGSPSAGGRRGRARASGSAPRPPRSRSTRRVPSADSSAVARGSSARAADPRTTRVAPASKRAADLVRRRAHRPPPARRRGGTRSPPRRRGSGRRHANARSMSTTWIHAAPAATAASAAASGFPPNASTGRGPSGVNLARTPPLTSIAGMTSNTREHDRGSDAARETEALARRRRVSRRVRRGRLRCRAARSARPSARPRSPRGTRPCRAAAHPRPNGTAPSRARVPGRDRRSSAIFASTASVHAAAVRSITTDSAAAWAATREDRLAHLVRPDLELATSPVDAPDDQHDPVGRDQVGIGLVHRREGHDLPRRRRGPRGGTARRAPRASCTSWRHRR